MANTKNKKTTSNTKKTNSKKTTNKRVVNKKTTSKKVNNKEKINYKLIILILVIILIIVALSFTFNANKSVSCIKKGEFNSGIKQTNEIILNGKNIINSVDVKKTIILDSKYDSNYLTIIEDSVKKAYKDKNIKCSTKIEDNSLIVNLSYTKKQKYILDDLDIVVSDDGVSVNIINDDNYNTYVGIDLSKDNNKDDLIKSYKIKNYVCK